MIHLLLGVIYLSFISLGLPDGLLGSAWPSIYPQFQIPVSYSGIIYIIISCSTIVSSLLSDLLTRRLGTGKVTAISVTITAAALFGFSFSNSFWMLCLWAIPYGLGAGCVDASLNNYVALHYASRHMSWLHCMWGIGASIGPYIMGLVLTGGQHWGIGYRYVGIAQMILTTILIFSLPLWKQSNSQEAASTKALTLPETFKLPGAKAVIVTFFCYCALEQTAGLWAASYLHLAAGFSPEKAASLASLFYLGITGGRAVSGFISMKLNDNQMIRMGLGIIAAGIILLLLPLDQYFRLAGLLLVGLGCSPVYPCMMHATPDHFGAEHSQALMGLQTAGGYAGTALMPPLFGLLVNHLSASIMGLYLLVLLVMMFLCYEQVIRRCKR